MSTQSLKNILAGKIAGTFEEKVKADYAFGLFAHELIAIVDAVMMDGNRKPEVEAALKALLDKIDLVESAKHPETKKDHTEIVAKTKEAVISSRALIAKKVVGEETCHS